MGSLTHIRVLTGGASVSLIVTLCGGPLPDDYTVTVSVGLAHDDGRTKGLHDLIAEADGALYEAKKQSRDRVRVAQASFDAPLPACVEICVAPATRSRPGSSLRHVRRPSRKGP